MAGNIKGIIVEIGGDTSGLQKALSKVNSATSSLSRELRGINSLLKLDPKNTELLAQKQTILTSNIKETEEKLKLLKQAQEEADKTIKNGGEISQQNYRNLQREIMSTENKLKNLKLEASNWTQAGKKIEEIGTKIESVGNKVDNLGNKLTTRVTAPLVALGVVGVKSAMEQESAMQQVNLIYGDASNSIKDFAENTAISFNMSSKDAYKYSQIYGNLIQSITDDTEDNAMYTQELLKASSVIASATGRTMEDVMDRIRSGLLGNTEAIEDLGVHVNVALLESTDAFKKFAGDKSWNQLDFQTQQQIRLFSILEQTTKKYGTEVNKNTCSSVQKVTAKFTNLTSKLTTKLLPIANKLLDKADKFIDKLDNLSDEQQENIIKIGLMVASAGPLIKIIGTVTNTVGTASKGIGIFTQAISVMKTGAQSSSNTANTLAKALTGLTSPAGLATIGITALTAAYAAFIYKQYESSRNAEKIRENTEKEIESQKELMKTYDESKNATISQMNSVSRLSGELEQLVDENGKVKQGYEDRVDFILNQLNSALGTEFSRTGELIDKYSELKKEINDLVRTKKAQAILESEEGKYNEAITKKAETYSKMLDYQEKLKDAQQKLTEVEKEYQEVGHTGMYFYDSWMISKVDNAKKTVQELQKSYDDEKNMYNEYLTAIRQYENDQIVMESGTTEQVNEMIMRRTTSYKNATDDIASSIQQQIANQVFDLQQTKLYLQQSIDANDEAAKKECEIQKNSQELQLKNLAESLSKMTSTTQEMTPAQIEAWKQLATGSYDVYKKEVSKMPSEMKQKIQEVTGVVINDTSVENATKDLGDDAVTKFDNAIQASKTAGENFVKGAKKGIENQGLVNGLLSSVSVLGNKMVNRFNSSLDEHSPSRLTEESRKKLCRRFNNWY